MGATEDRIGQKPDAKSKADRYDWVKPGAKGELRWINKSIIQVDASYQRSADENKAVQLARQFSWPAFGVILVARRDDGALFAMDGQHRVLAARRRSEIAEIPCIVFDMADQKEEAGTFLLANTNRKVLPYLARFKAKLLVGDPASAMIDELLTSYGRRISAGCGANTVECVRALTMHAEKDPMLLRRIWPLLMRLTEGRHLHERVVGSLMYIEKWASGASLTNPKWEKRVLALGADGIIRAANEGAAFFSKGGPKAWALGVEKALNRNMAAAHRLTLREADQTGAAPPIRSDAA